LYVYAKEIRAPVDLVRKTKHLGRQECRLIMTCLLLQLLLLALARWLCIANFCTDIPCTLSQFALTRHMLYAVT